LKKGCDINLKDNEGMTPLHIATLNGGQYDMLIQETHYQEIIYQG